MKITRLLNTRRSTITVAIGLLAIAGAGAGYASAAAGSLSVSPAILEHLASPGGVGAVKISNTTGSSIAVTLDLRPWMQSRGGEVSPNRARTLGEVKPSTGSFTLAAGTSRTVNVSLTRKPAGGSVYGAIEVTGAPSGRATNGIKVDYRLISSLRLTPPSSAQSYRAQAGSLIEQGSVRQGTLLLAVRNTGNTIVPIGGKVRVSGQGHSLSATATAKAIVPGATVNVPLTQLLGSLPKGRYTVTVALTQGGHGLDTVTRSIGLR